MSQDEPSGRDRLTPHLVAPGFRDLAVAGIAELEQPVLDRSATETGERVSLELADANAASPFFAASNRATPRAAATGGAERTR